LKMNISISAIICTHNRPEYLDKAIISLLEQDLPKNKYEILVVDNCSDGSTKKIVTKYSSFENIRYLFESNLGLSYARNTGYRNAYGVYIAYLDDDAIASPDWLGRILEAFESVIPKPGCVGGKTRPIWETARPSWLADSLLHGLGVIDWSDTPHFLDNLDKEWLVGANFAFPAEILEAIGGFDNHLDRVGKSLLSSGDVFLEKQIMKRGYSCYYHPKISVSHHIMKSRVSQSWFKKRYYWQGVSDAVMQFVEERPSKLRRLQISAFLSRRLFVSPSKVMALLFPTNNPETFTKKCLALIELGHIHHLLRSSTL